MKNISKLICLVLALALLFCGCGGQTGEETKEPAQTQPATEPEAPAITTEEALNTALEAGGFVTLSADLALSVEILVSRNNVLDCGGYTLTGPAYAEDVVETQNALTVTGGTVENVVVYGKYRAVGDRKNAGANSDVRLKNITVDGGSNYALNFGYGSGEAGLYVENSRLCGWSSYTKFREAQFTNCTFAWSENGEQGGFRPYINTTLIGCHFEGKTNADGSVSPFGISFKSSIEGVTLILENCYVGDTLITQENINQLLNVNAYNNIVRVQNSN